MTKHIAIYVRVSTDTQKHRSQLPDLTKWAATQTAPIVWYEDTYTGKTMNRPGWDEVDRQLRAGNLLKIACWKLDRLGRTTLELCQLFQDLMRREVPLVSVTEGIDLSTSAGRKFARDMASAAEYEREVRAERQAAGIAAARAEGKRWGGSKPGVRKTVKPEQVAAIIHLNSQRMPIAQIARAVNVSRPTIYRALAQAREATCKAS